jgi:hypothetical protein
MSAAYFGFSFPNYGVLLGKSSLAAEVFPHFKIEECECGAADKYGKS